MAGHRQDGVVRAVDLEQGQRFGRRRKYDEAYDYFAYLERNKSFTPGLGKAMEDYLYEEAKDAQPQAATTGPGAVARACIAATRSGRASTRRWGRRPTNWSIDT